MKNSKSFLTSSIMCVCVCVCVCFRTPSGDSCPTINHQFNYPLVHMTFLAVVGDCGFHSTLFTKRLLTVNTMDYMKPQKPI